MNLLFFYDGTTSTTEQRRYPLVSYVSRGGRLTVRTKLSVDTTETRMTSNNLFLLHSFCPFAHEATAEYLTSD